MQANPTYPAAQRADQTARTPIEASRGKRRAGRYAGAAVRYAVLTALALVFLLPFYLIARNALMTQPEITNGNAWSWWPADAQTGNFRAIFDEYEMGIGLRNSAILAAVNLVFQTLFASMAGYALARIPVRGKGVVLSLIHI